MQYSDYLKTDYWKAVSTAVKDRAGYKCQVCNSPHDLQAHHRTYEHRGNEMNHLGDLTCLCRRCHAIFHGKDAGPSETVTKQEDHPCPRTFTFTIPELPEPTPYRILHPLVPVKNPGPVVVLKRSHVNQLRTDRGGFTRASVEALGIKWPAKKGWRRRLIGVVVTPEQWEKALAGRHNKVVGLQCT